MPSLATQCSSHHLILIPSIAVIAEYLFSTPTYPPPPPVSLCVSLAVVSCLFPSLDCQLPEDKGVLSVLFTTVSPESRTGLGTQ